MYQQVIEAVAIFASHGNSGMSAPWEIDLVKRLCNWDIISPLRFTDVEISPNNWIMAVDINNIDLIKLDINYNIQWRSCCI